ncbi:MAG: helix-turn-helix transcriptional regulator [Rikenellaceae bacterium]
MNEAERSVSLEIGQRIAKRRKQLGLTQEQAAELSGLSHQFFACVERGLKNIRAENVIKLSKALNVSADYILLGESNATDRNHIATMLEPLSEVELKCMEEIIKNYLIACGHE